MLSHSALTKLLFLFLTAVIPLKAQEEIRVELATKKALTPVYLNHLQQTDQALSPSYLKELEGVLKFDLNYSGYCQISPHDTVIEKTLSHPDIKEAFRPEWWKKSGVTYAIKGIVTDKKLNLYLFTVKTVALKEFEGIQLTGDMQTDRRQIHKLSDALVKTLFNAKGIAHSHLLYSQQIDTHHFKAEIWECDWDGGNSKQVSQEQNYAITPSLFPTNDRYVYVTYKNGQPKIYLSSLKQKLGRPLIEMRGNQLLPSLSKKGDQIAFICDATGRADLFVQSLDQNGTLLDKPKQLFSYPGATQASPTYSPDGSKIAFVSDKDGSPRIYVISTQPKNGKRGDATLITKINKESTCPNWSPDGTKLAYSAKSNGVRQIWIYDFETGEETQLTTGNGNKENPCWAPNSLHLIFNSTDPDSSELYLVNLNQPEAVKISHGAGKKHYPTWGNR